MVRSRRNPGSRAQLAAGALSTFSYMLAMGLALVAALIVLMTFSASRGSADPRPDIYLLPGQPTPALFPEGIAAENKSGTFYVSSALVGSIYRGNVKTTNLKLFLPGGEDGRTQALGMTLDDEGRLYVAGGFTGKAFIYDTSSGALVRAFGIQGAGSLLNDVTVNPRSGDAYVTDSLRPIIWRVPVEEVTDDSAEGQLDPWLKLTGTAIEYMDDGNPQTFSTQDINLNGIVATPNGRYLLTVQTNTGKLFRIDTRTKHVTEIGLGDAELINGDGLVLRGHTVYVVRNENDLITEILLNGQFTSGRVKHTASIQSFDFPTAAAIVRGRMLVVNSQFDKGFLGPGEPEIPFTVSSIRVP
jgi:DNA-binding beta-propeller fold protein YncE